MDFKAFTARLSVSYKDRQLYSNLSPYMLGQLFKDTPEDCWSCWLPGGLASQDEKVDISLNRLGELLYGVRFKLVKENSDELVELQPVSAKIVARNLLDDDEYILETLDPTFNEWTFDAVPICVMSRVIVSLQLEFVGKLTSVEIRVKGLYGLLKPKIREELRSYKSIIDGKRIFMNDSILMGIQ